jgi:transcriptional regulator with XRE-family HTH domain
MTTSSQSKRPAAPKNGRSPLSDEANGQIVAPASVIDLRVARRIRVRRLSSGMTLQTLAQGIGVAFQQAHKYERGQSRISAGRLFHVAKALGAPITYFFLPDEEARALEDASANKAAAVNNERQGSSRPPNKSGFLRDQRGAVAALVAVTMTVLFGFAGLGVDVGIWYTLKRQSQSAADNAAISGAIELVDGKGASGGPATTDVQNLAMYAARNNLSASAASSLSVDSRSSQAYPNGCTAPRETTFASTTRRTWAFTPATPIMSKPSWRSRQSRSFRASSATATRSLSGHAPSRDTETSQAASSGSAILTERATPSRSAAAATTSTSTSQIAPLLARPPTRPLPAMLRSISTAASRSTQARSAPRAVT